MQITGHESLAQITQSFGQSNDDKNLKFSTKKGESALKIDDGWKFSGLGEKSAINRANKHRAAVDHIKTVLAKEVPGNPGLADTLLKKHGVTDAISVKQLKAINTELGQIKTQLSSYRIKKDQVAVDQIHVFFNKMAPDKPGLAGELLRKHWQPSTEPHDVKQRAENLPELGRLFACKEAIDRGNVRIDLSTLKRG
ncbi:MAG: hypothetical protein JO308_10565 [Verrucomicrobia bacterium]|nr:hypothetical protein [Verrucomicrobiota bacterium]